MNRIEDLIKRYPTLVPCKNDIEKSFNILCGCFKNNHKLLVAGNGGSCADADHIVGELMKTFKRERKIEKCLSDKLISLDENNGKFISQNLQKCLPAIALHNHQSLNTAVINDVANGGELVFAQQVLGYGQEEDVLLAISTSGNAINLYNACLVARAKGMKIIALTGKDGGRTRS